jgi:hypothetical protein
MVMVTLLVVCFAHPFQLSIYMDVCAQRPHAIAWSGCVLR